MKQLTSRADISELTGLSAADTSALRHDAITRLRSKGASGSDAADLITKTFPSGTRGVPVYVEWAKVDGRKALIVVQAVGPADGTLSSKSLWVLDTDGDVLFVGGR